MHPLTIQTRPAPLLVADDPALDFLNTVASPFGERIEWLADGEDLLAWMKLTRLITEEAEAEVRAHALPGELDAVAAAARSLREWFRHFVLTHKGRPISSAALGDLLPLNDLLARDESYLTIRVRPPENHEQDTEHATSVLESVRHRRWRGPSSLLLPVAETMATLVSTVDFTLVKKCECLPCTLLMHDTTQRHARRWCSMAICGNRAKQAAHRNRIKEHSKVIQ